MPKLAKKIAKKAEQATANHGNSGSFEPLPRGKYHATLTAVTEDQDNFGNDIWTAEFSDLQHISTGKKYGGRQWLRLQMPQDADEVPSDYEPRDKKKSKKEAWADLQEDRYARLKAFFESLGYTADSDTDEMVDDEAKAILNIGIATIQSGERKGEKTNRIYGIEPVPEDFDPESLESDEDNDDDF
jgi:hypothetical protein